MDVDKDKARKAALAVMAKMCLCDGQITAEEKALLLELLPEGDEAALKTLLDSVQQRSIVALCQDIALYEDRFFIALRAYAMAHVDAHFDAGEAAAFAALVDSLGITDEDIELIRATEQATSDVVASTLSQRLETLYAASSFALES